MPSTTPPIRPDSPGESPLRDEAALERTFRARYASLIDEAKHHLNDDQAAAPRVVETLFLRAWAERASIKSTEELDAFLNSEVAHGAARELARRASAHHFGAERKSQGAAHADRPVDVDQSWANVQRTLHPDRMASDGASQNASRHDAASHVKDLAKKRSYVIPIIIFIVIVAAAFGVSKYLTHLGREGGIIAALAANKQTATQTSDGQTAKAPLLDGSVVKLGPDSKLIVADNFGDNMRVISIEGAAAVTVAPGHPVPLQVRSFGAVVDAQGGTLIVRSYPADSSVTLVAMGGDDSVRVGKGMRAMTAGTALRVSLNGQVTDATPGELAEASTWVNDTLTIANRTLKTAIDEIRTWYSTKLVVLDTTLLTRPVTASAPLNSSLAAIAAVEKSAQVKFGYEGQAMVFRDAAKKK